MTICTIELGAFVDKVYESLGGIHSTYALDFQNIIGGCHCIPPTEWYGDIYITFKKVLNENSITDKEMAEKAKEVVMQFSKEL